MTNRNRPSRLSLRSLGSLLTVLLLGLTLRAVFYVDQVLLESVALAEQAYNLTFFPFSSEQIVQTLREIRGIEGSSRLIVAAVGLVYDLFGVSPLTSTLIPSLSALLLAVTLYAIGNLLHREATGLLAAFLWLILPVSVFLSGHLLPTLPIILISTLAVYFYLRGKVYQAWIFYLLSGLLLLTGLWLQWTYVMASAVFIGWDLLGTTLSNSQKKYVAISLLAATVLFLLVGQNGTAALEQFYLTRVIEENLFLFPLLALSASYVATTKQSQRPSELVNWLAINAVFLLAGARWTAADPLVATLGLSTHWLNFLAPGTLLIAWTLDHRWDGRITAHTISLLCTAGIILLLFAAQSPAMLTASRIALGLTLVAFAALLIFWNAAKPFFQAALLCLLALILLGTFSTLHDYWLSYRTQSDNARAVLATLSSRNQATLFIGGEELLPRFKYMVGFQPMPAQIGDLTLTMAKLRDEQAEELPPGAFVIMSKPYQDFSFGSPPQSWLLIQETQGQANEKLLLFQVSP